MVSKFRYPLTIILISVALSLISFYLPITRDLGEMKLYDIRLRSLRNPTLDPRLQFIAIDTISTEQYGGFPWPRALYGDFIERLDQNPPMQLIFDVAFTEPSKDSKDDERFAQALSKASFPVILPFMLSDPLPGTYETRIIPVSESLRTPNVINGYIRSYRDFDGKIRLANLAQRIGDRYYPSIDLVSFALLKGVSPDDIRYEHMKIIVGDTVIPTIRNDSPEDDYTILIDYHFPRQTGGMKSANAVPSRSFYRYMTTPANIDSMSGKVIIFGIGSIGMGDDFPTPVEDNMYGSAIHLNILNTLLHSSYMTRVSNPINLKVLLLISFLYGISITRFNKIANIAGFSIGLLVLYLIINFILFRQGYWLDLLAPILTIIGTMLVVLGLQFSRTHKLIRQFVVPEVADQMIACDSYAELGGTEKEVSILFSDIRGYTSLSENMTPTEITDMLNEYHAEMVKVFEKYYGRVVDYMGDAQMVIYGAPIERADHAVNAINAALDAQDVLEKLCTRWGLENRASFEVGIGICTGVAAIGLVGAEGHKQYTAIGDTTNTASRLQGQSKILGAPIILSPKTVEQASDHFDFRFLGEVPLKGKSEPMKVFTIEGRKEIMKG